MLRAIPYTSLWFGNLLWLLLGGSISAATVWWLYEDYIFAYDSKQVTGIVEHLYTTVSHGGHGGTQTHYNIQYYYQVSNMTLNCTASVAEETFQAVSPGVQIPILYIPGQLANNRIDLPAEQRDIHWTSCCIGIATFAINLTWALILRHVLRQNKIYRHLIASGVTCQGIVDSVPYDLVGKNRVARFYLTFTFTDNQGQSRSGKSWYLKTGDEVRWRQGNPVQVYFDPADPAKFTVDLKRAPLNT